jgi:hypothetical protein
LRHALPVVAVLLGNAAGLAAQEPDPVYQTGSQNNLRLRADALMRQEWTRDIFVAEDVYVKDDRRRLQFRPRLEFGAGWFQLGVGGEFNYGSDRNTEPPGQVLIRDNYDSRDARLDLAFAALEPVRWLRLEGGRFVMPVALTEMIWDKDLRPQGGAVTLQSKDEAGTRRFALTALAARGSHVFDDDETNMVQLAGLLNVPAGPSAHFELVGSFIKFTNFRTMETRIRRQNTRVAGQFTRAYEIIDVVARLTYGGTVPVQLVGDFCWNRKVDDQKRGLWLAMVLGSLRSTPLRAEYVYAKVDKDATLGAYGADDFFWTTGWAGHKVDVGTRASEKSSLHAIGQLQRFKDSPRPEERDHWLKRFRIELRVAY